MFVHKQQRRRTLGYLGFFLCALFLLAPASAQINTSSPLVLRPSSDQTGFGFGLASGDVNGDGISDIVAGSVLTNTGGFRNAGQAFVFFGGSSPSTSPQLVLESPEPEAEARFGWAVAIGDVNGDGFGDIVVSALFANGGANNGRGEAYVFFGGPTMKAQADVTLESPDELGSQSRYGFSIATGDLNGDGIDDAVVGAEGVSVAGAPQAGAAFVYFGSRSFNGALGLTLRSPSIQRAGSFGNTVAIADFNGDGLDDVAIGAPGQSVGSTESAGQVFIFFGGSPFDATPDLTLQQASPTPTARFGLALATGDVNADGRQDLIVGAPKPPQLPVGPQNQGEIHVILGGQPMSSTATLMCDQRSVIGFGSVLGAGDVNRDGRSDILAGVPVTTVSGRRAAGLVLIFFGGSSLDCTADLTLQSPAPTTGEEFGLNVATGDFNNDRRLDVIVGAPNPPSIGGGGGGPGKVFVFPGS